MRGRSAGVLRRARASRRQLPLALEKAEMRGRQEVPLGGGSTRGSTRVGTEGVLVSTPQGRLSGRPPSDRTPPPPPPPPRVRMEDPDTSQRSMPVAPMLVESGTRKANVG